MQSSDWDRLAAPFSPQDVTWRIEEFTPDGQAVRVRPQLSLGAIAARLDDVVGKEGWSLRFHPSETTVACHLEVAGVVRSGMCGPRLDREGAQECGEAALARAAELFGLHPPFEVHDQYWVDYDAQEGVAQTAGLASDASTVPPRANGSVAAPGESGEAAKPEGQRVIDKLVERLKAEGMGLEAARLLVEYGGYGSDPGTARELYGRLRELLARSPESTRSAGES